MNLYDSLLSDTNNGGAGSTGGAYINGVTTGVVKENWEEKHPGMVKVEYFMGEEGKNLTGWMPVMTMYAGNDFGYYSLPEVDSEVVVGFNMGDRNCPIVLGCLWNNVNKLPAETANDKNYVKRFKTKGGCEVLFSEESGKEIISVKTPAKLSMIMDDENNKISIGDESGDNGIVIDAKGGNITITAKNKIEISPGGSAMASFEKTGKKASINADTAEVSATQTLKLKGQSAELSGTTVNVTAQGSLKAEASGITEVKGSMVKVN